MAVGLKYKPFQYQEAYIPFDLIPQVDQALGYHQQRYDQTNASLAKMYQDMYDRQIYDPEAFKDEVDNVTQRVTDINQKYHGDLSAGMNDYINLIGSAKNSPFWKLNDAANEKQKQYDAINMQLRAAGQSPLEFKKLDRSLRYTDPNSGEKKYITPDMLNFDVQGQLNYTGTKGELWDKALHEERNAGKLPNVLDPSKPWVQILNKSGIDDTQVRNKIGYIYEQYKDSKEYKQEKRKLTELEGLNSDEAEAQIIKDIIATGESREYMSSMWQNEHNPDYAGRNSGNGESSTYLPMSGTYVVDTSKGIEDTVKKYDTIKEGLSSSTYNVPKLFEKSNDSKPAWLPKTQIELLKEKAENGDYVAAEAYKKWENSVNSDKAVATKELDKLKNENSILYNKFKGNDEAFIEYLKQSDINGINKKNLLLYHPTVEAQNIFTNSVEQSIYTGLKSDFTKLDKSLKPSDTVKGSDIFKKNNKITTSRIDPFNKRIIVYNNSGEAYEVNPNLLGEDTEQNLNITGEVLQKYYSENDNSYKPVINNKEAVNLYGNPAFKAYKKGEDGLIHRIYTDSNGDPYTTNGKLIEEGSPLTESDFTHMMINRVYGSVNPSLKDALVKRK